MLRRFSRSSRARSGRFAAKIDKVTRFRQTGQFANLEN
jgi:hypothetical protein